MLQSWQTYFGEIVDSLANRIWLGHPAPKVPRSGVRDSGQMAMTNSCVSWISCALSNHRLEATLLLRSSTRFERGIVVVKHIKLASTKAACVKVGN